MRTTHGVFGGLGVSGVLIAAAACTLLAVSSIVAYRGWPDVRPAPVPESLVLSVGATNPRGPLPTPPRLTLSTGRAPVRVASAPASRLSTVSGSRGSAPRGPVTPGASHTVSSSSSVAPGPSASATPAPRPSQPGRPAPAPSGAPSPPPAPSAGQVINQTGQQVGNTVGQVTQPVVTVVQKVTGAAGNAADGAGHAVAGALPGH